MFNVFMFVLLFSLLFTVALLLFTCLCVLCKRKQRKTRDVNQQHQHVVTASTSERSRRPRPSLAHLCGGDVESSTSSGDPEAEERHHAARESSHGPESITTGGRTNLVFESDNISLPPGYDEALKSKYAKVYSIYPSLGSLRRASAPASLLPPEVIMSPSTSSSSGCSSASTSLETVVSRLAVVESPPPPYDQACVHYNIDSRGHF